MRRAHITAGAIAAAAAIVVGDVVRVAWLNLEARIDALASDLEDTIAGELEVEGRLDDVEDVVAGQYSKRGGLVVHAGAPAALARIRERRA